MPSAWNSNKLASRTNARPRCRRITKDLHIDTGFRADIVVAKEAIVELKAVERLLPVHAAQLLIYLKMSGYHIGLLLNFHALRLKDGLRRFVL